MTFCDNKHVQSSQLVVDRYSNKSFLLYSLKNSRCLFTQKKDSKDIILIIYILGKRLSYSADAVLKMDPEQRDALFDMEMDLIEHEKKQSQN